MWAHGAQGGAHGAPWPQFLLFFLIFVSHSFYMFMSFFVLRYLHLSAHVYLKASVPEASCLKPSAFAYW